MKMLHPFKRYLSETTISELDLYLMMLYRSVKFEWNWCIPSKVIDWKPKCDNRTTTTETWSLCVDHTSQVTKKKCIINIPLFCEMCTQMTFNLARNMLSSCLVYIRDSISQFKGYYMAWRWHGNECLFIILLFCTQLTFNLILRPDLISTPIGFTTHIETQVGCF